MMKPTIRFSKYQVGNEELIFSLFDMCFSRKMDPHYWKWRYVENPVSPAIIELAWDDDILISHYAVTPVKMQIEGRIEIAGLSGATMTHPNYRGLKLFPMLAERVYQRMIDNGMKMVWGFPNTNSHRTYCKSLNWREISDVPFFRRRIRSIDKKTFVYDIKCELCELTEADRTIDSLWNAACTVSQVAVVRSSDYVKWRYFDNPVEDYRVFKHLQNDCLKGFAVTKTYHGEIQIVDIVEALGSNAAVTLVQGILGYAALNDYPSIALWCNDNCRLHKDLATMGFVKDLPTTHFGARLLSSDSHLKKAMDYSAWQISMGDSDNF